MRTFTPSYATLVPQEAKKVFDGLLYSVWQWQQKMFDGSYKTFEMLKRCDSVVIIAVIDEQIMVQHEAQPHRGRFIDVPAGMHDLAAEDEQQCAMRELREESGYTLDDWKLIACFQYSAKIEQLTYVFLATGNNQLGSQKLDAGEQISSELVGFDRFIELLPKLRSRITINDALQGAGNLEELLALPDIREVKT